MNDSEIDRLINAIERLSRDNNGLADDVLRTKKAFDDLGTSAVADKTRIAELESDRKVLVDNIKEWATFWVKLTGVVPDARRRRSWPLAPYLPDFDDFDPNYDVSR